MGGEGAAGGGEGGGGGATGVCVRGGGLRVDHNTPASHTVLLGHSYLSLYGLQYSNFEKSVFH